jgi:hypothetical protein
MARTIEQIKAELDKVFPREWSDNVIGNAITTGIATVLQGREVAFDGAGGWLEQMFVGSALDFWLDEHGRDYGVDRAPGEVDADYRLRLGWTPRILTEGNALSALSAPLPDGSTLIVELPYKNALDSNFFLGDTSSILTDAREIPGPKFLFWIFINPAPEVVYLLDSFLDVDSFLGIDSYLDETKFDLNRQHIREVSKIAEGRSGYGIAWGATFEVRPEPVIEEAGLSVEVLESLFPTSGGYV